MSVIRFMFSDWALSMETRAKCSSKKLAISIYSEDKLAQPYVFTKKELLVVM